MTGPVNDPYQRRFPDPAHRLLSNRAYLNRFDGQTQQRIEDLLTTLDSWDLVTEAERATRAEAQRQERARRWETSGQIRRGDPGE